ncbi:MAG: tRNA lysidine(34) synthetase TilS, partial [Candidatus Paceibacterales bacterium]
TPPKEPIVWDIRNPITLPDGRVLTMKMPIDPKLGFMFEIRFRQNGERCQPAGRQGSHPLKKLFQEWGVPPWERDAIPLLYLNNKLVCVVGYCVCKAFAAVPGEKGWITTQLI